RCPPRWRRGPRWRAPSRRGTHPRRRWGQPDDSRRRHTGGAGGDRVRAEAVSVSTATPPELDVASLDEAVARVAAGAAERDRAAAPPFPEEAIADLEAVGALAWNAQPGAQRPPAAAELGLVRSVARADGSIGRILDGHLNGVERLAVQAPDDLRNRELAAVRAGRLRVGVWGGDPRPDEGVP